MSDLTDKLHEYANLEKHSIYVSEALREAADEIDRLREEVSALKSGRENKTIEQTAEAADR